MWIYSWGIVLFGLYCVVFLMWCLVVCHLLVLILPLRACSLERGTFECDYRGVWEYVSFLCISFQCFLIICLSLSASSLNCVMNTSFRS